MRVFCFKLLSRLDSQGLLAKGWIPISAAAHHMWHTSSRSCRLCHIMAQFNCLIKSQFMVCWWWGHNFAAMCVYLVTPGREGDGACGCCGLLPITPMWPQHSSQPDNCSGKSFKFHTRALGRSDKQFFHYTEVLEFALDDSWILLKRPSQLPLRLCFNMHMSHYGECIP